MKEEKGNKRVSVIGGLNVDIAGKSFGNVLPDNSNPGDISISIGGVAGNIARTLKLLRHEVQFFSATGDTGKDVFSRMILEKLEAEGLDTLHILSLHGYRAGTYLSILDSSGKMVTSVSDTKVVESISPEHLKTWERDMSSADFLIADTNLRAETLKELCRIAEDHSIPLLIEPVSVQKAMKILETGRTIDYLTPNEQEYHALFNAAGGRQALERIRSIIITRGKKGVTLMAGSGLQSGKGENYPAIPVDMLNPTGAGDSFAAGFVHALLSGIPEREAVYYGIALAAVTIQSTSPIPENVTEVLLKDRVEKLKRYRETEYREIKQ